MLVQYEFASHVWEPSEHSSMSAIIKIKLKLLAVVQKVFFCIAASFSVTSQSVILYLLNDSSLSVLGYVQMFLSPILLV